jgi:type I restriction enzyme S subunit
MFYSKINKELVFPKYLYYTLKTFDLASLNVGSAVPSLTTEVLNEVLITIPSLPTQKAIAEILSSLDDKIELNSQINQNLESFAQALFKQWFVDFEFPNENGETYKSSGGELVDSELGEIPKGWVVEKFGNISELRGGGTPSTKESSFWDGNINWSSPKDLSSLRWPLLFDTDKKITSEGLSKISSGLLPVGTLLLSSRAPIGYMAITQIETAINQGYIAINGKYPVDNIFLLIWLKANMDKVIEKANGSTFLEISKSNFREIKILVPSEDVFESFTSQTLPIFEKIIDNAKEILNLEGLRDTLLPKLISGELEVNESLLESTF